MLVLDKIFPKGIRIPDYFHGKNIVHLPTIKCHIYTNVTGAMKNAFGGLLDNRRHYCHSRIHETLVDLLAIQKEIFRGLFAVMDGTTAGNGAGPRTMVPVTKNVLLASADCVAIDAVAAKMMGFDPMDHGFIRLAHERGLGVGQTEEIEIVGDADAAAGELGLPHRRQRRRPRGKIVLVRADEVAPAPDVPHADRLPLHRWLGPVSRPSLVPPGRPQDRQRLAHRKPLGKAVCRLPAGRIELETLGPRKAIVLLAPRGYIRCRAGLYLVV